MAPVLSLLGVHHYYNSVWFRLPVVNLFWPFLTTAGEHVLFSQYTAFLNNVAIVTALILALSTTFYAAVSFEEMRAADMR